MQLPNTVGKIRVLVLSDYYLPGFKSGGPLRTISNMAEWMREECVFFIYTRDRDATDKRPYPGIRVDDWNDRGPAKVFYASPRAGSLHGLRSQVRRIAPDVVYLNSFFSTQTIWFLVLRRLHLIPQLPVVIAPRGELSPGALRLKSFKKSCYLRLARWTGLYRGLRWQASADLEAREILAAISTARDMHVAPDLTPVPEQQPKIAPTPIKEPGALRLVFCSRVAEKKNPHFLLPLLARMNGAVDWNIYGPLRDPIYWARCEGAIARLPANVTVRYLGELTHEEVAPALVQHHFFVLPTLSENFGHAIIEALVAGCPVLISDQTPWHDVPSAGAGWVLPVDDPAAWEVALREALAMDETAYREMSARACEYGRRHFAAPPVSASVALFREPFDSAGAER